jgi:hypothetical protein
VPIPFEDAPPARSSLLGTAQFGAPMDPLDGSNPLDLNGYPGWQRVYPALRLVGPMVTATPSAVSVYRGLLNPNAPGSATNPKVIAFAVMDTKGVCAAGAIRGFPTYNQYPIVDIAGMPCNAQSVLNVLRR